LEQREKAAEQTGNGTERERERGRDSQTNGES